MTSKAQRLSGLAKELDALAAASSSTLIVYEYTATAGQTVFSGVDNNGLTLNYIAGNTLVVYNEGVLQKTVDYATTSSSVLTLTSGAEVGALVRMYAFGTFAVANVYTKPESDAIITNLALKSASKADIIGVVSQAAGVPTGAIIESGSNANGNYIKYADGTMICTRVVSGTYNVNNAFGSLWYANIASQAFAATFIAAPICNIASVYGVGAVMWGAGTLATTTGSGSLTIVSASSFASAALTISLVAIGRWF